jgi:L-seryl-tRNA(Ser) seleniumtransferase
MPAVPSFEDLGSGCLIDLSPYGVKGEPVVSESLKAGSQLFHSARQDAGGPQQALSPAREKSLIEFGGIR